MKIVSQFVHDDIDSLQDIDSLSKDDILIWNDIIDQSKLELIVAKKGCPGLIVNDHAVRYHIPGYPIFSAPIWTYLHNQILQSRMVIHDPADIITKFSFNFMINKKQINRYLLIKLVEIFNLSCYDYTWSGIGRDFDLTMLFAEVDRSPYGNELLYQNLRLQLGQPLALAQQWVLPQTLMNTTGFAVVNYGKNFETWNNGLHELFSTSAVSLISESVGFEKGSVLTEKTLYSIYGLTFPLFVGGYKQCEAMTDLGFDMFEDIFDHSYQDKPTLFERCYQAFRFNHHLLSDFDRLCDLREQMMERLVLNRQKLLSGEFRDRVMEFIHRTWPRVLIENLDLIERPARSREGL